LVIFSPRFVYCAAKTDLEEEILNWGYLSSKSGYYEVLGSADVVVSTAKHEFYGVAMLEGMFRVGNEKNNIFRREVAPL
jgi:hypothetical protein